MSDIITAERQFKSCCRMLQVQLARATECFDLEESYKIAVETGKLNEIDIEYIRSYLNMNDRLMLGDSFTDNQLEAAIRRIQMYASCQLNCGDSA